MWEYSTVAGAAERMASTRKSKYTKKTIPEIRYGLKS